MSRGRSASSNFGQSVGVGLPNLVPDGLRHKLLAFTGKAKPCLLDREDDAAPGFRGRERQLWWQHGQGVATGLDFSAAADADGQ